MERWKNKVALVTGASSGIGAATVVELVRSGMVVVGMARRVRKLRELSATLPISTNFFAVEGDVSNDIHVKRVFDFIKEMFGTLHVLVNNAAIVHLGRILSTPLEIWKETFEVNVLGLTNCCKQAVSLMRSTGVDDGHIININSIAGHGVPDRDDPIMNVYPASKNAVTAVTETLRFELVTLGSSIKVTSVSPGYTNTEMFHLGDLEDGVLSDEMFRMFKERPRLFSNDIAKAILAVLATPPHVQITEITVKPVGEPV